jgi:hypothetical protein
MDVLRADQGPFLCAVCAISSVDVGAIRCWRTVLGPRHASHMRPTGTARRCRLHSSLQSFDFAQLQLQALPQTQSIALGLLIRQDSLTDCQHDCKGN